MIWLVLFLAVWFTCGFFAARGAVLEFGGSQAWGFATFLFLMGGISLWVMLAMYGGPGGVRHVFYLPVNESAKVTTPSIIGPIFDKVFGDA